MTTPSDEPGFDQYVSDPVAHFESIPWCAALMKDKSIIGSMVPTRTPVASTESSLVNTTLNSGSTIRACATWLRLVKKPEIDKKKPILEIFALVDLGEGMNGYAKTLQGGLAGVLLDEVMSVSANQAAGESKLHWSLLPRDIRLAALNLSWSSPDNICRERSLHAFNDYHIS